MAVAPAANGDRVCSAAALRPAMATSYSVGRACVRCVIRRSAIFNRADGDRIA